MARSGSPAAHCPSLTGPHNKEGIIPMSIEENLQRIADALEAIAGVMTAAESPALATVEAEVTTQAQPKQKGKRRSKAKEEKSADVLSDGFTVPTTEAELIALMTEKTKGLPAEKMIELSSLMRETYKVAKLPDLPEEDYENFARDLEALVNN